MRTQTQPGQELRFTGKYNEAPFQLKAEPTATGMKVPLMEMMRMEWELYDLASWLLCDCGQSVSCNILREDKGDGKVL